MFDEPASFGEARFEFEMAAGERAAEFAGDEDGVAGFRAGAEDGFAPRDEAEQGDGNQNAFGVGGGFAAHDGDVVFAGEGADAGIDGFDEGGVKGFWQSDGDEGGGGSAGHGGDVAQAAGEGFVADFFGRRRGAEMDSFDEGVGFEEEQFVRQAKVEHGAIITGAGHDVFVGRKGTGEFFDQFKFVHERNYF